MPYLNKLVDNINRKEYLRLLIIGFIFLILIPSIIIYNDLITDGIYLFYYYLVGGYIRLYYDDIKGVIKYLVGFIILYFVIVLLTMFLGELSYSNELLLNHISSYARLSSILVFGCAICMFLFFKGLKLGNNKIINVIASTSFGVYLFHEYIFMKELLWNNIFSLDKILGSNSILISGIIITVLIYIIGFIIDLIRQVLFKYFNRIIEK